MHSRLKKSLIPYALFHNFRRSVIQYDIIKVLLSPFAFKFNSFVLYVLCLYVICQTGVVRVFPSVYNSIVKDNVVVLNPVLMPRERAAMEHVALRQARTELVPLTQLVEDRLGSTGHTTMCRVASTPRLAAVPNANTSLCHTRNDGQRSWSRTRCRFEHVLSVVWACLNMFLHVVQQCCQLNRPTSWGTQCCLYHRLPYRRTLLKLISFCCCWRAYRAAD